MKLSYKRSLFVCPGVIARLAGKDTLARTKAVLQHMTEVADRTGSIDNLQISREWVIAIHEIRKQALLRSAF